MSAAPPHATTAWSPLEGSSHAVALDILRHGPSARADLARRLGLSSASATRLTKPLLDAGVLRELDTVQGTATGRPSQPLDLDVHAAHFIGVKIVTGACFAVVTDLRGRILARFDDAIDTTDARCVVDQLAGLVARIRATDDRIAALGVSLGATITARRVIERSALLVWERVDLADDLTRAVGLPTHIENDVVALTQAEHWFGIGHSLTDFMVLTIGVGVGGGIVSGGRQLTGVGGAAGTIGHLELDPLGPRCASGHIGCAVTTVTSGAVADRVGAIVGRPHTFQEALDSVDPGARHAVAHAAFLTGKLAGVMASVLAPQVILLSGDGIGIAEHHPEALRAGFQHALPRPSTATRLEVHPFDFWDWARGAAVVALQMHVSGY